MTPMSILRVYFGVHNIYHTDLSLHARTEPSYVYKLYYEDKVYIPVIHNQLEILLNNLVDTVQICTEDDQFEGSFMINRNEPLKSFELILKTKDGQNETRELGLQLRYHYITKPTLPNVVPIPPWTDSSCVV